MDWSSVNDKKNHYDQDEEKNENGTNLSHVIGLEEFGQFFLHEVQFFNVLVDAAIKFLDESSLLINLLADLFALEFESASDFVNLVEVLVLFFDEFLFNSVHGFFFVKKLLSIACLNYNYDLLIIFHLYSFPKLYTLFHQV